MMAFRCLGFASAAALLLAGCATTPPLGGGAGITVLDTTVLPTPDGAVGADGARPYRIGPGDELLIDVLGIETLAARKITTDGNGRISLPMAGVVDANGLTVAEVEVQIARQMRAGYVRNPIVSVNISEARSKRVTVDGQVRRPGQFPVVGRLTLMQAVALAEGAGEFAKLQDVVVFRTIGDQRYVALYNLAAIRRGAYPDPEVFADDVVMVGESTGRRMFQTIVTAATLVASPIVALIQR
jgi:polysaccharide export outer membrane protein